MGKLDQREIDKQNAAAIIGAGILAPHLVVPVVLCEGIKSTCNLIKKRKKEKEREREMQEERERANRELWDSRMKQWRKDL